MVLRDKDGRELEVELDSNCDGSLFITYAVYVDTGELLDESLFEELERDNADELDMAAFEHAVMRAESFYEGDR